MKALVTSNLSEHKWRMIRITRHVWNYKCMQIIQSVIGTYLHFVLSNCATIAIEYNSIANCVPIVEPEQMTGCFSINFSTFWPYADLIQRELYCDRPMSTATKFSSNKSSLQLSLSRDGGDDEVKVKGFDWKKVSLTSTINMEEVAVYCLLHIQYSSYLAVATGLASRG